jgi:hypothetical protein
MNIKILALIAVCFFFTGCFDIYETFNIIEDGSGVYDQKINFSRSLALLSSMSKTKKKEDKKDTTIYYSSIVDTSTVLTAEEKAVMRKAYAKIHMDEAASEMWFNIFYPYANGQELTIIQTVMSKGSKSKGITDAMAKALGKPAAPSESGEEKPAELPTQDFNYTLTANSLARNVKPNSTPDKKKDEAEEMPPMFKEMMKMNFTTTISLPRPVKNWSGNNGTLSADKKQLQFRKNVDMDTKLTPADFNFSIDY